MLHAGGTNRFAEKVVVVVGGNSGIGLAAAKAFANEGGRLVICGRNSSTLASAVREIGSGSVAIQCDVRDASQIAHLFDKVRDECGTIDVLFVNSGVLSIKPIEQITEADWDYVQDTNLKGTFFTVQAGLTLMKSGAAIVLTGSTAGHRGVATACAYATSKGGITALGRSMAAELASRGIRVNVVSPGPTETPIYDRAEGLSSQEQLELRREQIRCMPMKRMSTPEEIAAAILFLASDAATSVTGVDFVVDGGLIHF